MSRRFSDDGNESQIVHGREGFGTEGVVGAEGPGTENKKVDRPAPVSEGSGAVVIFRRIFFSAEGTEDDGE